MSCRRSKPIHNVVIGFLIFSKNFPSDRYISFEEASKNVSMILLNSHFSQSGPRPYVPAMVEVGGLQIKPTLDKLPEVRLKLSNFESTYKNL